MMKKFLFAFTAIFIGSLVLASPLMAQCSICAKTVQQMGTGPAEGFNAGIIYLMAIPYITLGVIAYNWWKKSS